MEIKEKGYIYGLYHEDKIIYVGKSFGNKRVDNMERKKEHFRNLKYSRHPIKEIQDIYDINGTDSIRFEIVDFYEMITDEELMEKEIYYIEYYNTYNDGFNKTIGGSTVTGMKQTDSAKEKISNSMKGSNNHFYNKTHTLEAKQKMSEVHKGKTLTEEQKQKVSQQWKGVPKSPEHRRKIGEAIKGRTYSEETLKKMSEAKKGKKWSDESKKKRLLTIKKLSDEQIKEIYIRANTEDITNRELGELYGVGKTLISNIKNLRVDYIKEIIERLVEEKDLILEKNFEQIANNKQ